MPGRRRILAHPWRMVAVWVVALVVSSPLGQRFHDSVSVDDLSVIGSDSAKGQERLDDSGLSAPSEIERVVFVSDDLTIDDADYRDRVDRTTLGLLEDTPVPSP